jgi:hypothetical protein
MENTYLYPVIVANSKEKDGLFLQNGVFFLFFAKSSVAAIMMPILQQVLGERVAIDEQYFPAALFLEDKDGPSGLDTNLQLSPATWEEVFIRFAPTFGTYSMFLIIVSSVHVLKYTSRCLSWSLGDNRYVINFSETCGSEFLASFLLDSPIVVLEYHKKMQQKLQKISAWVLKTAPLANIDAMKIVVDSINFAAMPQKDWGLGAAATKKFKADKSEKKPSSIESPESSSEDKKKKKKKRKRDSSSD